MMNDMDATPWKFTLRGLMSLIFIAAATLAVLRQWDNRLLLRTGRPLDLAIVGEGYLETMDVESGYRWFTRQARMHINENGELCIWNCGRELRVQPPITFPSETQAVEIAMNGLVTVEEVGEDVRRCVGELQLSIFSASKFSDGLSGGIPAAISLAPNSSIATLVPIQGGPGQHGLGILQQGWLEVSPFSFAAIQFTLPMLIICVGICWLAAQLIALVSAWRHRKIKAKIAICSTEIS